MEKSLQETLVIAKWQITLFIAISTLVRVGSGQCFGYTYNYTASSDVAYNVESPNYPNYYYDNLDCEWRFVSDDPSRVVKLTFLYFSVEYVSSCYYDYVTIYDGYSDANTRLAKICGSSERSYTGTGRFLIMQFRTDSSVQRSGFQVKYESVAPSSDDSSGGTTTGIIVGIVVAVLVFIGLVCFCCCCKDGVAKTSVRPNRNIPSNTTSQTPRDPYPVATTPASGSYPLSVPPLQHHNYYGAHDPLRPTFTDSSANVVPGTVSDSRASAPYMLPPPEPYGTPYEPPTSPPPSYNSIFEGQMPAYPDQQYG